MTNPDYTALALTIDRSGSMRPIAQVTQEALEEYLNGQSQLEGKLTVNTVFFDDTIEERAHLADASNVDLTIKPRGMTALYDAIGSTISSFGELLSNLPEDERPERVLVVIATDGAENSSKEYSREQVAEMIKHQQEVYSWKFVFIGANQDAVLTAERLNIARENSLTYAANTAGTRSTISALDGFTASYRSAPRAGAGAVSFSEADRAAAIVQDKPVTSAPSPSVTPKRSRKNVSHSKKN